MIESEFDKYVRNLLHDAEEEVSPRVWEGVAAGLAKKRRVVPVWGWAAASVAAALGARLITCFEQPGVLRDREDPSSVIPIINKETYAALKADGIVADGMIPKLDQAFDALAQGAREVRICHSSALLTGGGTVIK